MKAASAICRALPFDDVVAHRGDRWPVVKQFHHDVLDAAAERVSSSSRRSSAFSVPPSNGPRVDCRCGMASNSQSVAGLPAPARHGSRRPRARRATAVRLLGLRAKDSPARSRGWHRDDGRRDRPPACAARSRARFQARSIHAKRQGWVCGCWRRASRSDDRPTASGSRLPDRRCGARRLPAPRSRRRCRARSGTRPLRRRPRRGPSVPNRMLLRVAMVRPRAPQGWPDPPRRP